MNIQSLAKAIHNSTGLTGDALMKETFEAAYVLAVAFGKNEAAAHFLVRASEIGKLGVYDEGKAKLARDGAVGNHKPGWNFGNMSLD